MKKLFLKFCGTILSAFILLFILKYPFIFFSNRKAVTIPIFFLFFVIIAWRLKDIYKDRGFELKGNIDLGISIIFLTYLFIFVTGGVDSKIFPLVYFVISAVITFWSVEIGTILLLSSIVIETILSFGMREIWPSNATLSHIFFLLLFGLMSSIFKRTELFLLKKKVEFEIKENRKREEALVRDFKLLCAPSLEEEGDLTLQKERLIHSIAKDFKNSLVFIMNFLKKSLDLYTVALYWLDQDSGILTLKEIISDCEDELDLTPQKLRGGVIGGIFKKGETVILSNLRESYKGIPYYKGTLPIRHFLGVPIRERLKGEVVGVLCCDRKLDRVFSDREVSAIEEGALQIVKAIEDERIFVQLERTKNEQAKLYKATKMIASSLSEEDVLSAGISSLRFIAEFDFVAITLYDKEKKEHRIVKVEGKAKELFEGKVFSGSNSLVSMSLKMRHYLPYKGRYDPKHIVFDKRIKLSGINSLLVIPLFSREEPIGTIVIGSEKEGIFNDETRHILQILSNQLALSLMNAKMVKRLEEMATQDSLTGLFNRRVFKEQLEFKIASAKRFGYKLSLIMTDLDHFKSINDTYGHSVGDEVLKRFAQVLKKNKRETDIVARYGGEEFVIICENTDSFGARQLAERIREDISKERFVTDIGEFKVTCSLGIATFPDDADSIEALIERADIALYNAKENGRDQAVIYSTITKQNKSYISENPL